MAQKKQNAVISAKENGEPIVNLADVLVDWAALISNDRGVKPVILLDELHYFYGCLLVAVFDLEVNWDFRFDLLEDLLESAKRILVRGFPFVILKL